MDRRQFLSFIAGTVALPSVAYALPSAPPQPHRLKLLNAHTKETFSGIYRDDNGPIPRVMDELSLFLRDFHTGDKIGIDIDVLDFLSHVMPSVAYALPSAPPQPHRLKLLNAHTKETFRSLS